MRSSLWSKSARYVAAALAVAGATNLLILIRGGINPTTVALAFLLMILFVAMIWGSKPALLAAVLGMLSFNFFFLPHYHTFAIADPQNWIALIGFARKEGITHVVFGQSARSRWDIFLHGSVINRFLREVRDASVHVVPLEAKRSNGKSGNGIQRTT